MARSRPVSRQFIQKLVNSLQEKMLVEMIDNPDHKTSRLVTLTKKGTARFDEMQQKERAIFSQIDLDLRAEELQLAVEVLLKIRTALESPGYQKLIEDAT